MAYTNQWPASPEAAPPDTELAKLLALNIRDLELNIRERMDDALFTAPGTWALSGPTQALVVKPQISGNAPGKAINIHHSAFVANGATGARTADKVLGVIGALTFWAPLILASFPYAVTIRTVDLVLNRAGTGSIQAKLRRRAFGVITDVATANFNTGGAEASYNLFTGSETLQVFAAYFIEVVLNDVAHAIFQCTVGYDAADSRQTL